MLSEFYARRFPNALDLDSIGMKAPLAMPVIPWYHSLAAES